MLRNRILNNNTLSLTLSNYSYDATPSSGTITVTAYYKGVAITDLTSSMVSCGGNMSSVSINSSGIITMNYNSNTSTSSTATSTMTLTYNRETASFIIAQPVDYEVSRTEKSKTTSSTYSYDDLTLKGLYRSYGYCDTCTRKTSEDEAKFYVTNLKRTDRKCKYYQVTYASGNIVNLDCHSTYSEVTTVGNKTFYCICGALPTTYTVGNSYSKSITPKYNGTAIRAAFTVNYTITQKTNDYDCLDDVVINSDYKATATYTIGSTSHSDVIDAKCTCTA